MFRIVRWQKAHIARTYLKNKIRVQGKTRNGEKEESASDLWRMSILNRLQRCHGHLDSF